MKRTLLKKKADQLFRDIIRARGECQLAGLDSIRCAGNLQTMHIIGRANYNLRWDELNALCGCAGHHIYYTNHPWEWQELIKKEFPEIYVYLNEKRNLFWDKDYDKVIERLSYER